MLRAKFLAILRIALKHEIWDVPPYIGLKIGGTRIPIKDC